MRNLNLPEAVSVVIPTYNRADLIGRALQSALGQLMPGDEIIVVDDGSTDNTETVVKSRGEQIRYVRGANGGAGGPLSTGTHAFTWEAQNQ